MTVALPLTRRAPREWVSFEHPTDPGHEVRADLTWLLSSWTCVYGTACQGVVEGRAADGCCSHGAFFSGRADEKRVRTWARALTADDWELHGTKRVVDDDELEGEPARKTRTIDGACVFLNSPSFAGGAGCALHRMALRIGRHPLETKPDVCWQLPIKMRYEEGLTVVGEYDRAGWGEGGADLHWWCTESPEAFVARDPLYLTYAPELAAILGEETYAELARLCAERLEGRRLTHPAESADR